MFDTALNIVIVLAILVLLVVVHEFGHFIVARSRNVRVHEFGIGFPPRALTFGHWGETAITLNWLPIGGFVRLEGEEGQSDDARSFVNQKLRTRLAILFAGVGMNLLLAWLIFTLIAAFADPVDSPRLGTVSQARRRPRAGPRRGQADRHGRPGQPDLRQLGRRDHGDRRPAVPPVRQHGRSGPARPQRAYLRAHAGQTVTLTVQHADGTGATKTATLRSPDQITPGRAGRDAGRPSRTPASSTARRRDRHRRAADGRRVDADPARPGRPGHQHHQPAGVPARSGSSPRWARCAASCRPCS